MRDVKICGKIFEHYLANEIIQIRIKEIAEIINNEYKNKKPLFIVVLNGSFIFAADLFKKINIDCK